MEEDILSSHGVNGNTSTQANSSNQLTRPKMMKNDVPRQKLPTFDGKDNYDGFIIPFNRAARRNDWTDEEKLDRYIESLRGPASKCLSTLPRQEREIFESLSRHMENRFNRKEPSTTARKKTVRH